MEERNGGVGSGGGIGECFADDIFADPEHDILKDFLLVSSPTSKQLTPELNSLSLMKHHHHHQPMQPQMPHTMDLVGNLANSPSGSTSGDPMLRTSMLAPSTATNAHAHLTSDRLHGIDSSEMVSMVPPAPTSCMNSLPLPGGPVNCLPPPAAPPPPLAPQQNCMSMPPNCHDMMGYSLPPPPPNHLVDPYVNPPSGYPTQSPVDALVGFTNNCAAELNASAASSTGMAFNSEESSLGTQDELEPEDSSSVQQGHQTPPATMSSNKRRSGSGSTGRGRKRRNVDASSTTSSNSGTTHTATRGRPPGSAKRKNNHPTHSVTYQSQISPDVNGIKIRIKKSSSSCPNPPPTVKTKKREKGRRRRKGRVSDEDDDDFDDENSGGRRRWVAQGSYVDEEDNEPAEQSLWAMTLPEHALEKIFTMVVNEEGSLPFLVRASHVCRLWRRVAGLPRLWHNADLTSTCIKDRFKNEHLFKWLCEHRLGTVRDLNIGGWEFAGIQSVLETISERCQDLQGLNITGCKELSGDHLKYIAEQLQNLNRLDLSSINPESNNTRCAVSMLSLTQMAKIMGERLTHLTLANNKIAGMPQIITALSTHCPNLQVLDLSNMRTVSHTTAAFNIELLQGGCQKLRVLRITNSQITPAFANLTDQMASPGFPLLEELSVAGVNEGFSTAPLMDDNALERILKSSHKLRLLDVRGCLRISDSSLVRIPAWDLEHLFLSGCYVTRLNSSGLELIAQKWAHSLIEIDLAWSTATEPLDQAVETLAEKAEESPLKILNLCGSSINLRPVKAVVTRCPLLTSLNLSSCRALPRGMKRLYDGDVALTELRSTFERPPKVKAEEAEASTTTTTVKNEDNMKTEPEDNDVIDDNGLNSSSTSHDHRNYENSYALGQPLQPDPSSSIM